MRLAAYDIILINSSAGKDSQAMLTHLVELADNQGVDRSRLVVVHADLGRVEWTGTRELAEAQAQFYGLRFEVVSRPQGDLLDHVEQRRLWPSSKQRYCTSDHKRDQVQKLITRLSREFGGPCAILSCMGIRAEESSARAKKIPFEHNLRASSKTRSVDTWLPIFTWSETEVWAIIKRSGVPHHRAYGLGMTRLSCCFCIFAPRKALKIAAQHNPELLDEYVAIEGRIGHRFRVDLSLAEVQAEVQAEVLLQINPIALSSTATSNTKQSPSPSLVQKGAGMETREGGAALLSENKNPLDRMTFRATSAHEACRRVFGRIAGGA